MESSRSQDAVEEDLEGALLHIPEHTDPRLGARLLLLEPDHFSQSRSWSGHMGKRAGERPATCE